MPAGQVGNVIITGGSSGLGAATAEAIAAQGGTPLILDRSSPAGKYPYLCVDVADSDAVDVAVRALADEVGGRIDGLLTAAGVDACGKLADIATKDWERVIHVNLLGTAAAARAALPFLRSTHGRIVTCASTLGIKAVSDATAYCASKFGVVGFSRALATELAGEVGVTTLIPGGMHTAFFDGRDEQYKPPPDAKLNDPAHVAKAILFALSQPAGCEIRELVVCASTESSWP